VTFPENAGFFWTLEFLIGQGCIYFTSRQRKIGLFHRFPQFLIAIKVNFLPSAILFTLHRVQLLGAVICKYVSLALVPISLSVRLLWCWRGAYSA